MQVRLQPTPNQDIPGDLCKRGGDVSYSVSVHDPAKRKAEKEAARRNDIERLKSCHVDTKALARGNGLFSGLKIARVHIGDAHSGFRKTP